MKLTAYCQQCGHKHPIDTNPSRPDNQCMDWYVKHSGHFGVGIINHQESPRRSKRLLLVALEKIRDFWRWKEGKIFVGLPEALDRWGDVTPMTQARLLGYLSNANVKIAYGASAAFTITLASLASSSTLVAGENGTAVSNSGGNLYLDYLISGQVTTGTSPTVSTNIETWMIAALDDTPNWPDSLTNTDAAFTTTSRNQLFTYGRQVAVSVVSATSNVKYPFAMSSLAMQFGGACPRDFEPFVTHSTAVNLNSTAGNHFVKYLPVYMTVV